MIVLAIISLYLIAVFVTTVIIMVTDEACPKTDPSACLAVGFFWSVVALVGLFVGISKVLQKIANWIIQRRSDKGI